MPRCNKCMNHYDELEGVFVYEDVTAVFYCDDCNETAQNSASRPTIVGQTPKEKNMREHNPSAWQNGFDAWQCGYDDAMYDGIDMASELPCRCVQCLNEYQRGQEDAFKEIFAGSKSAQQSVQPTAAGGETDGENSESGGG